MLPEVKYTTKEQILQDLKGIMEMPCYKVKDIYKILRKIKLKLGPQKRILIKKYFRNFKRKKSWSLSDIAYAIALTKKGFRTYNFLRDCIPLPSRKEIRGVTKNIHFNPGLNEQFLEKLSERISNFHVLGKTCSLYFHEIKLTEKAVFDKETSETVGYVNLGCLGSMNVLANRALVFMANGIHAEWKQPIAYYFIRDTIDTSSLKHLVIEVISALQRVGLIVLTMVFDHRPSNQSLIEDLCYDSVTKTCNNYFKLSNKKIYCLYDPCSLLKLTRDLLYEKDIEYGWSKVAKWEYIEKAFERDNEKMYRHLYKMQKEYVYLDQYPEFKNSVTVAAYTFSRRMSSGIGMCVEFSKSPLPEEAFGTCQFVLDMNNLFDSFNGSSRNEKNDADAEYRRVISSRSKHLKLWKELLPKIYSWVFVSKDNKTKMFEHPVKAGWLRNIETTIELWRDCKRMGLNAPLSTRCLNLDPLHLLLNCVRYFNPNDYKINCYQFMLSLKSLLLNNLKIPSTIMEFMADQILDVNGMVRVMPLIHSSFFVKQEDLPNSVSLTDHASVFDDKAPEYNQLFYR